MMPLAYRIGRRPATFILAGVLAGAILGAALPAGAVIPTYIVPCGIQSLPSSDPRSKDCNLCMMGIATMNLTNFLIYAIAIPITALLVASGGIVLMSAGPSEERIKLGKNILFNTLVGAVIVFIAWILVDTTIKVLTGGNYLITGPGVGPWYTIDPALCSL